MEPMPRTSFDALLEESGWARRLARSLVRDAHAADDLVQRAWLAALRRPPHEGTPPRRWLASVLRNLARSDARETGRRHAREADAARPAAIPPDVDDVEERIALQERLLRAVRELPEPSRSTVWARYGEGLAPREIARRDGVPIKTVRTRLARGLEMLRARFDREHGGDRKAWVALLLPLADPTPLAVTLLATIAMDVKLKIAALLTLVVCGTGVWLVTRDGGVSPRAEQPVGPAAPELLTPEQADPQVTAEPVDAARVALGVPETPPLAPLAVASPTRTGLVIDLELRPVAGLTILDGWKREPILVDGVELTSDAHGRFQVPREVPRGYVTARGPGWVSVFATQDSPYAQDGLCVVVARERTLSGKVVDAGGVPVANAFVEQTLADTVHRKLGEVLRGAFDMTFTARTDSDGRFQLAAAPDAKATLHARAENGRAGSTGVPAGPIDGVVIELPAPAAGSILLHGRVVDPTGNAVDRATVALADASVRSGADGHFELAVLRTSLDAAQRTTTDGKPPVGPMPLILRAAKAGHLPAKQVLPELQELERIAPSEEWRVVLGGPPLSITGRVVDSAGNPVREAWLKLLDEEAFGRVEAEFSGMSVQTMETAESILRGSWGAAPLKTDLHGRFAIEGLQAREYRLDIVSEALPAARVTEPIRAGASDIEIVLDTTGARTDLAGRVVDKRGEALANVSVRVLAAVAGYEGLVSGRVTLAEADGRFHFQRVRVGRFQLRVDGIDVVATTVDIAPGAALDDLVVTAPRRAFVQVDLGGQADLADTARFVDVTGEPVSLNITRTTVGDMNAMSMAWMSPDMEIKDGRSEVGSTAEGVYMCVLLKAGKEVARIPARLGGKGVTIVRP